MYPKGTSLPVASLRGVLHGGGIDTPIEELRDTVAVLAGRRVLGLPRKPQPVSEALVRCSTSARVEVAGRDISLAGRGAPWSHVAAMHMDIGAVHELPRCLLVRLRLTHLPHPGKELICAEVHHGNNCPKESVANRISLVQNNVLPVPGAEIRQTDAE